MSNAAPFAIIADSSRMGTHMLEKIIGPVLELACCHDDEQLQTASARSPDICLISYQWPELDSWLENIRRALPAMRLILLASPESDARRLAELSESHQASVLYRPYEPARVIREVVQRLAETGAPEAAAFSSTDITGPDLLTRDMAFCRRYHLSHSVLALRIDDYAALSMELGESVLNDMEFALTHAIGERLRREDSICDQRPGLIVLSLPGTPPLGAKVLAHRLRKQLNDHGVEVGGFQVHPSLVAGIHSPQAAATSAQPVIDEALEAARMAKPGDDDSTVLLTADATEPPLLGRPEAETVPESETPLAAPSEEQLWEGLEEMLAAPPDQGSSARQAVLGKLVTLLTRLDENARMRLVDELLLASARAD